MSHAEKIKTARQALGRWTRSLTTALANQRTAATMAERDDARALVTTCKRQVESLSHTLAALCA